MAPSGEVVALVEVALDRSLPRVVPQLPLEEGADDDVDADDDAAAAAVVGNDDVVVDDDGSANESLAR